jgi:hypothetical protein
MSKINVVFLGQLRNWDNFISQLKLIKELKDDSISVSYFVDDDELSREQEEYLGGILDNLVRLQPPSEAELLKFDPMMLSRSSGIRSRSGGMRRASLWRQLIDLNTVYAHFSSDDYLIRTRTDINISSDFLESIILKIKTGQLENKVWVQWWNLLEPFYIHDTAFAGKLGVLRKYIDESANLSLAKFYPTNSLPMFFWILPYIEEDWVKIWLSKYSKRKPNITFLVNRDFRLIIRKYIEVVDKNFCVEFGEIYWFLQWSSKRRLRIWKNYIKYLGPLNLIIGRNFVEYNFKSKK